MHSKPCKASARTSALPWPMPPVKITDVRTILTAPNLTRLVVVKVETSEPGLYGLGCATFTQRALVVQVAVDKYLKPLLVGQLPALLAHCVQLIQMWSHGP